MCAGCALTAMAGATGARAWLQAHHLTWLTPQRLRAVTIALFVVATLVPTVVLSGSTPTKPTHAAPSQAVTQHR